MSQLIKRAAIFAKRAHGFTPRKYTHELYWHHPERVAAMVASVGLDDEVVAAAWLHDVVEDTQVVYNDIFTAFGDRVANLVDDVTDQTAAGDRNDDGTLMNRETRKAFDRMHLSTAHPDAMSIKLADLIDNTESITRHDPDFAVTYLREKRLLMPLLKRGHPWLFAQAWSQVDFAAAA